jgi:hypothetical protein
VALAFVVLRYKSRAKSLELREKQIELNKRELDKADSKLFLKILAATEYNPDSASNLLEKTSAIKTETPYAQRIEKEFLESKLKILKEQQEREESEELLKSQQKSNTAKAQNGKLKKAWKFTKKLFGYLKFWKLCSKSSSA